MIRVVAAFTAAVVLVALAMPLVPKSVCDHAGQTACWRDGVWELAR